jgi:ribose 5-phosphate isomerase B
MRIGIGTDHVGFAYKKEISDYLKDLGHEVVDYGTYSTERTDYPIWGSKVARELVAGNIERGVLICGTGVGISLSANRFQGVRAVVCSEPYTAKLARAHNNANIIAFGSRVIGIELAKMIVEVFLTTEYEGGRHQQRIDELDDDDFLCGMKE